MRSRTGDRGFHVTVTDRIAKTDILARASSGSASIHKTDVATIRGLKTIICLFRFLRDPLACAQALFEQHGRLVVIEPVAGLPRPRVTIIAVGATYNRAILGNPQVWNTVHHVQRGPKGSALDRMGGNVISMNGAPHDHYRKLVAPPIGSASVADMGDDIAALIAEEVARWPLGQVDLWHLAQHLVRSVAIALLLGGDQSRGARLAALFGDMLLLSNTAQARLCPFNVPGLTYARVLKQAEAVERCAHELAERKRGSMDKRDLLSLIVNSPDATGAAPAADDVAGHLPILFASTYETCQTVLLWSLVLLAQHPDAARNLVDEISGALAGEPATPARVSNLPLLDAVVKESMRVLPAVPYQVRLAAEPTGLGGYDVAAGSHAILSPFLTNRDPQVYDEPTRFRPDRWSHINPTPFEYLAFSGGPRMCPGSWFGTAVVKVALATILSRLRVSIVPDTRIDYNVAITMKPRKSVAATLHPRDGAWAAAPLKGQIRDIVTWS
jgi:cytochrome P450